MLTFPLTSTLLESAVASNPNAAFTVFTVTVLVSVKPPAEAVILAILESKDNSVIGTLISKFFGP